MAKSTKKVRIISKYGTYYGASLRKMVKKIEISMPATLTPSETKMKDKLWGSVTVLPI
uniref:Uncharacterized protein n=3 Tax=Canis lupus TaxID=9612 RepID=A0A8C0RF50_CANLF